MVEVDEKVQVEEMVQVEERFQDKEMVGCVLENVF